MNIDELSKKQLIGILDDFAKNWLAHDGLWFQAVEHDFGMDAAIKCDTDAWRKFTVIEAKRIMKRHDIPDNSGLNGLKKALVFRMYSRLNIQSFVNKKENSFEFQMNDCRVQSARKRHGLPDFPCKSVGLVEYTEFAKTIDARIKTVCIECPPDDHPKEYYCSWKFYIDD